MIRRAIPAVFAVVLLVLGQLGALAHEAGARHVRCSEHGEQVEAAALLDAAHIESGDHAHYHGNTGTSTGHRHCAILQALHQASTPGIHVDFAAAPVSHTVAAPLRLVAIDRDAVALYVIAPKTSPPSCLRTS